MTRSIGPLFLVIFFMTTSIYGQDSEIYNDTIQQYPFEETPEDIPDDFVSFFEVKGQYDVTGQAKVTSFPFIGDHIRFEEADLNAYYTHRLGCNSALTIGLGDSLIGVFWKNNPFFRENHFNNFVLSLSGFSEGMENWFWQGGFSSATDTRVWNWRDYTIYTGTVWGRYTYCEDVGVHVGLIGQTGIDKNKMQPILGIDFSMFEKFKINLIYPVNMSIAYSLTNYWALSVAARIIETRHRVGVNEPLSRGIFEYRNVGAEFGVSYLYEPLATINVHVGSMLGGDLKITNQNNRGAIHVKQDPSYYVGGAFEFKF